MEKQAVGRIVVELAFRHLRFLSFLLQGSGVLRTCLESERLRIGNFEQCPKVASCKLRRSPVKDNSFWRCSPTPRAQQPVTERRSFRVWRRIFDFLCSSLRHIWADTGVTGGVPQNDCRLSWERPWQTLLSIRPRLQASVTFFAQP